MTWRGYSVFGLLLLAIAALMCAPAIVAALTGAADVALSFAVGAAITAVAAGLVLLATRGRAAKTETAGEFVILLSALVLAPVFAAIPIALTSRWLPAEAAYFEMVSTFTTTGATVFERPADLHPAIHLWRGATGWLGGFIALVMGFALLAPRNLGGFEVRGDTERRGAVGRLRGEPEWAGGKGREASADRIAGAVATILPLYAGFTALLTLGFLMVGVAPMAALITAMGVLATSGVQSVDGPVLAAGGVTAEAVAVPFLILAATRHAYGGDGRSSLRPAVIVADQEMKLLAIVVISATGWLFLRHWVGALQVDAAGEGAFASIWGAAFTTLSFATTTGYESVHWSAARSWSGHDNPSLVLFGLAVMGGGVATTAGGVKLLRAYALFRHGTREMERLVRPSSIRGSGAGARAMRREGAQIAWVFVMLFLVALAFAMLALSLTGLQFETALAASVAALSNTGPIFTAAAPDASWLTSLSPESRAILGLAMVLGRVELLALIAMLNIDNWR